MSIKNIKNIQYIIPAAAVAVLAVGYFGLSSYASNQAEQRLTDFVKENNLSDSFSWKSVSSSPLGGTVTINKVKVENEQFMPVELLIDKVVIKDFNDDADDNSANILLSKIQPIDNESEFGQYYHDEIFGMVKALNQGEPIAPYDMQVNWHYLAKKKTLAFGIKVNGPNVAEGELAAEFDNVVDLASLSQARYMHPAFSMIPDVSGGRDRYDNDAAQQFDKTKIKYLTIKFKDQGYLERLNSLEQRYSLAVSPLKGDVDKQRKELAKQQYQAAVKDCEKNMSEMYNGYEKACAATVGTWFGQEKGFKLVVDPKKPVSLSVLDKLGNNQQRNKKIIDDFNISVKSL